MTQSLDETQMTVFLHFNLLLDHISLQERKAQKKERRNKKNEKKCSHPVENEYYEEKKNELFYLHSICISAFPHEI